MDINLNVGSGAEIGESIIQDVKGVSVTINRSLRDLLHQIPSIEVSIEVKDNVLYPVCNLILTYSCFFEISAFSDRRTKSSPLK